MEQLQKWRMILGKDADKQKKAQPLTGVDEAMDNALDALYGARNDNTRSSGLGQSAPSVNRWLGDIRRYFPTSIVKIMQKDALERLNLNQMLLEPELLETLEPDVYLVATLLSLNQSMPNETRQTARQVVQKVVEDIEKKLAQPLREAVRGALSRSVRNRRPKLAEMDWNRTIRANLKNYQPSLRTIIPEHFIGRGRRGQALREVILLVDQSGSMASSVVYAAIFGAVMASLRSLRTHMIVFSTDVIDLTEHLQDPIELLFGTQLGGGTDIAKALLYTEGVVQNPSDTILILISDLFEGGNAQQMRRRAVALHQSGVIVIVLLALSDDGKPSYDKDNAAYFAANDIPSFACTPDKFPALMAAAINRRNLTEWAAQEGMK